MSRFKANVISCITIAISAFACVASVGAADSPEWLTGKAFWEKLNSPATVIWKDSPIRRYVTDFARAQHVGILLDRRVDPDGELTLTAREKPVLAILQMVAESRNLRISIVGNVVYAGPPKSAERIRTVLKLRAEEISAMGRKRSEQFAKREPLAWQDFDSPREILGQLAKENGIEIVHPDQVPHDLWAGNDFPPMSLTERLTLVLHQFDLTFQVSPDGRRIAVVPIPSNVAMVRNYPAGSDPEAVVEVWRAKVPNGEYRVSGHRIFVRGLVEDLEAIERLRAGHVSEGGRAPAERGPRPPLKKVFTASVEGRPLGTVLSHFARQLELDLQVDQASLQQAGISLDQPVSFRVEEATFDELFQAVLKPVGCVHERRGRWPVHPGGSLLRPLSHGRVPKNERRTASGAVLRSLLIAASAAVFFQFLAKRIGRERLDEIVGDAGLNGLHDATFFRFGRDHDNGYVGVLGADFLDNFQAGFSGHVPIRQDHLELSRLKKRDSFRAIGSLGGLGDADSLKRPQDDLTHGAGIVSDENSCAHLVPSWSL